MTIPICLCANSNVVEAIALGKAYWYCRGCKTEVTEKPTYNHITDMYAAARQCFSPERVFRNKQSTTIGRSLSDGTHMNICDDCGHVVNSGCNSDVFSCQQCQVLWLKGPRI